MILESLSFTETVYAFDFDGTLAKIVRSPDAATMTESTTNLINELSQLAPVAILSGRGLSDLKKRLSFKPTYLIGNHGLEGLGISGGNLTEAREISQKWNKTISATKFSPGIEIEDKIYSLAVHYRRSRNKKEDKKLLNTVISTLKPSPHIVTGKSVVNLLPQGSPHKGMAMIELMKRANVKHSFYIGDDDTDEDIFGVPELRIMSVRVGYKMNSSAQFYINRQSEINRVLKTIIGFHKKHGKKS